MSDLALPVADLSPDTAALLKDRSGREKAAILLVALGAENASSIMNHLPAEMIEPVSLEMAKTRNVAPNIVGAVVDEAVHTARAMQYMAEGGVDYAREVLERALGADAAAEIIARLSSVLERRPFEFLRRIPAEQIHAFLRQESAQTVALVVANLHTKLAAEVLASFDEGQQVDIAMRIATLGEPNPDVVRAIEDVIRQKVSDVVEQEFGGAGGVGSLAEILNFVDRSTERNVLDSVGQIDSALAEELRALLFTFEDILGLDDRQIQLVLREVEQSDLALALKGVAEDLRNRVFSNMSERGAENLKEEISFMPPQKRQAVEESQSRIVAVVRRLEEAGTITIARGGEDDLVG